MADYKHGAYGMIQNVGSRVANDSQSAIVYVGTAPVHTAAGGGAYVNKPVLAANLADARKKLGYSEDYEKYTLCEAMQVHFEQNSVGPVVFINVLDPAVHKKAEKGSKNLTPVNGRIVIAGAEGIVLDSVNVGSKVLGTDYQISYNWEKQTITITELTKGALGDGAISITYDEIDTGAVDADDIIGSSDGYGLNKGLHAIKNVYQETGKVPAFLLAPGWSCQPEVHDAMAACSRKINGHWDAYMLTDLSLSDEEGEPIGLQDAAEWKAANGYTCENETVYFPMALGTDGKHYHLSVLAAANLQKLMAAQDGIPYRTASNTACGIIRNLWMGGEDEGRVYDDTLINNVLNANGIASAAFVGGKWVIWGAHSADYSAENADSINVSETNRMMLYYISNDFQRRRSADVDKILSSNDVQSIVAEEQARLDALLKIGAILYGECHMNAEQDELSDIMKGDFSFTFNVTTTPLAKSLTAVVNWTADGFVTYFGSFDR